MIYFSHSILVDHDFLYLTEFVFLIFLGTFWEFVFFVCFAFLFRFSYAHLYSCCILVFHRELLYLYSFLRLLFVLYSIVSQSSSEFIFYFLNWGTFVWVGLPPLLIIWLCSPVSNLTGSSSPFVNPYTRSCSILPEMPFVSFYCVPWLLALVYSWHS